MGSIEPTRVNITDIRRDKTEGFLLDLLTTSLHPKDGSPPGMPALLLYDGLLAERGLQLFEEITYLDEYYLTNAEIETLSKHAEQIVARIPSGTRLLELGSGNLRKVDILLTAFEKAQKPVDYYALDVSLVELQRTFSEIDVSKYQFVSLNALHGTYDDALSWLRKLSRGSQSTCVMTLGSSLGNFTREEAADFLRDFKNSLSAKDWILVGLDGCQNEKRVFAAYNDSKRLTEKFYRNGLDHANQLLGYETFKQEQWSVEGEYDKVGHLHRAAYVALEDITTPDISFSKGQRLVFEYAYKYSNEQCDRLWHQSGLISQLTGSDETGDYRLHLLSPSVIQFSDEPSVYASQPVPSLDDWERLWAAWDTVTKSMVPREELMNKPIQLRNNLIFYLGHIPTFADIHFTKATGEKPTDPAYYYSIFERGIDPDVDNPELCHDHSEIPDSWPPLEEISAYSSRVRSRMLHSIQSGAAYQDRRLGRGLWLAYEHEAMHLETFLYMLLQSSRVLPPPGQPIPNFQEMAKTAEQRREPNAWHEIPASDLVIGTNDAENYLPPDRYFAWDNERPTREVRVQGFSAQSRGISNGEYARYLEDTKSDKVPAGWITQKEIPTPLSGNTAPLDHQIGIHDRGLEIASEEFLKDKCIRSVYGPIPLKFALDWPVMASYDELAAYATWAGARIPTFEEIRSLYKHVDDQKTLKAAQVPSSLISAVNGHLCNDGVEESPPASVQTGSNSGSELQELNPDDTFTDLAGCNVGFKNWHPTVITGDGDRLRGQGDAGGLWEWTSSPLAKFEGFKAMDLYPGYTADFFDNKHNIILGGSWATVPRIAGRKSFVNWYQRNYPYTWATARLVRDLE